MKFGAVAIGRNEGERLQACLTSICGATKVVYVDSGSTDGSLDTAKQAGAEIVILDTALPFTAARARNAGFERLWKADPSLEFVQFVDGDCQVVSSWPLQALAFLEQHPEVAAVAGRRRERFPTRSVFNWLCDIEWSGPAGESKAFGGDVMIRVKAFREVGGYRDDMIAGEEPELCVRLRQARWRIWRLDAEMTLHDAGMTRFSQWWRRSLRGGYAYALGASLHGKSPDRHKIIEARRAWAWGLWLPVTIAFACATFGAWPALLLLAYPLQIARISLKRTGPLRDRLTVATFQTLAKFPEAIGQIMFARDHLFGHNRGLIEYK
ncbi:glycosyltransferase [Bradyrhizobium sp. WYCCWR 13023]|uniref:Glycosyltransferase n=1 Tax=Bradyrhizobium zhengyangense TaxID=2911009 RepID=A0A9X1RIM2_9BRAD|nr:glycosyltransferase [Bradyrhizobium zhengyangense]MCG2632726.1 glycosyltransferase [Bradyrhizobium zhengyangense]